MVRLRLAARSGAGLPGSADRDRARSAGLSRRARERVQGNVLRGVSRLLPHRHDHPQRAQRDHSARHDDPRAAQPAAEHRRLGGMVHHRGRRARPAHLRGRLRGELRARQLRPRPDAGHVHRFQEAALPLGLRRHADSEGHGGSLFTQGGPLSAGQRYHFVAGWLPWMADGCNLLFNAAALAWSAAMVLAPRQIDPPLVMYSVLPLSLFSFKLAKLVHLYRSAGRGECAARRSPRRSQVWR